MYGMHERGITIVEVIIGVAIAGLVIVFISHTITLFLVSSGATLQKTKALYLAEEGLEIMRYLRDEDWSTIDDELSNGTTYYLSVATSTLGTTTVPEVIDGIYTRSFELSEVRRDNATDDIVSSGGSVDGGSRWVTFFVSYDSATVTMETLLTNIFDI